MLAAAAIRDLLKAALRHRPDRIILGEIRGGEAFDLLQLLNTGHSGTLSTLHASSAKQGLSRFTSCVLQSGVDLPYRAIKTNIGDSLNVVVQLERRPGRRFVSEVMEINGFDPDTDLYDFCAIHVATRTYHAKDFVISVEPRENFYPTPEPPSTRPHNETPQISQSERDWSYAIRALSRGEDPEEVIKRIADYRAYEKPNPDLCRVNEYADKVNQNSQESGSPDDRTRHKR